ncbi:metal ABC transporter solute-binding protein, Zn/Mn family [Streptococcus caprae]|uniref:Metal ABC transporter solute-binding protein, Zn/Mn family n=1 Tax=Streptococcus caprae TaxID=1640501 RepID=A0ABV8CWG8_9STRE
MKKKWLGLAATAALTLGLAACSSSQSSTKEDDKLEVVASFYPIYEFTKNIVGEEGNVELLIGAGTEVHGFEPSTKDMTKIQNADAFVYDDENMETWVPDIQEAIDSDKVNFVKATGDMLLMAGTEEEGHDHNHGEEGHHHEFDPHVWLSPTRAITMVENIRDNLSEAYPDKAETFKTNADAYIKKLEELDKEYSSALSTAQQKSFVTQHAAFGYLALDYGLTQVPITGISADTEPTAQRLTELVKYVKEYEIKYIYFEENASSTVAKTLADEAGVKTAVLNPLESLTNDQMKAGEDYFSVMRSNLEALQLTTNVAGKAIQPEEDTTKTVANGYFEDANIKDRTLSDWTGEWQSVYPYLLDGTLDQVWDYKAKKSNGSMTAAEYKDYYTTGYKTDVEAINIDGDKNTIEFVQNGKSHKFTYEYVGYKVLTYKKGNRGVRFLFTTQDENAGEFKNIQFSDHGIAPQTAEHFHLFWGAEDHEVLFEEMENWPTYYPADLTGHEIAQEIVAH